jgi:hypothetical protein
MDPTRRQILECNRLAREGRIPTRHAPFAEHILRIPERDFAFLCRAFPAMLSKDAGERSAAILEFQQSPLSEPYRVRHNRSLRK